MERTFVKHYEKIKKIYVMSESGGIRSEGDTFHRRKGLRKFLAGWLLLGLPAFLLIFPLSASAHSPSDVQLAYNDKEQMLQVTITHGSYFPNSHYVKKVEIQKNSENPFVYEYDSQPNKDTFTYTYKLPLMDGDRVEVKASCNLFGSKSSSLTVAKPATK
ncbi:MAG: hypothetical protein ABFD75_04650 [Smithella sp.]